MQSGPQSKRRQAQRAPAERPEPHPGSNLDRTSLEDFPQARGHFAQFAVSPGLVRSLR